MNHRHAVTLLLFIGLLFTMFADRSYSADTPPHRPNILWIITEDMGPELACYGHARSFHAQRRSAGGHRRAIRQRLYHGTGLLGQPLGLQYRHVPDDHRRPQPPFASHRRLSLAARCRRISRRLAGAGYFTANVREFPKTARHSRAGEDRLELQHRRPAVSRATAGPI